MTYIFEKELNKHSLGEECPKCNSSEVRKVSSSPDGLYPNTIFECRSCGKLWEGL